MCGIGTIFATRGRKLSKEHHNALEIMAKALYLRGPDAQGSFLDEQIGIIHTRLSILDPHPRSTQPMESEDWVLSYNGEIYNYKNIRRELQEKHTFHTNSDSEVLLLALQEWGIDIALQKCAGMFAFLAYNKREKSLYGARDRMGIKPLFLSRPEEGIFFLASSPAAICKAFSQKNWQPYKPALASYFVLGAPFTTMSVIEGIERVEPAHYVKIYPNGLLTKHKYWEPQYQENFVLEDLIEIVREHQVSDVKSALFLSGGVDSTFLASITDGLDFFHLKSPETRYAQMVAQKYQRPYVEVNPALNDYEKGIRDVCSLHGEPYMSCGIPYIVSKEVASHGYKMALSANGADELFFGYPRTPIPEHATGLPSYEEASYTWFHQQLSHIFRDTRNFHIPDLAEHLPSLKDIGFYALKKFYLSNFPPCASHRWFELMTYVLHDLNPTLDAASMANSLEVRVPFLDHRIVQGILSWKSSQLVDEKYGRKSPLKKWISKDFSRSFVQRPKLGFSIDKESLKSISVIGKNNFMSMQNDGFIEINKDSHFGHYERDMIYLEQACFTYSKWNYSALSQRGILE